jgi:hypothetical protein
VSFTEIEFLLVGVLPPSVRAWKNEARDSVEFTRPMGVPGTAVLIAVGVEEGLMPLLVKLLSILSVRVAASLEGARFKLVSSVGKRFKLSLAHAHGRAGADSAVFGRMSIYRYR